MPVKKELLAILCCPVTKVPVEVLPDDKLGHLNELIGKKCVKRVDGSVVEEPLKEALITTDGKTIYRIDEDIPVMLADMGIPAEDLA